MINSLSTSTVSSVYQTNNAINSTASATSAVSEADATSTSSISSYSETAAVYEPSGAVVSEDLSNEEVTEEVTEEVATSTTSTTSSTSTSSLAKVAASAISETSNQSKIDFMLEQAEMQAQNFSVLISSTFSKQADKSATSSFFTGSNLKDIMSGMTVDAQTAADAQAAISEDGYFGVSQTAERISSLALAIAGDDPDKLAEMVTAIDKGFEMATKAWGDELPEISQQTYDQVMVNLGVSDAK